MSSVTVSHVGVDIGGKQILSGVSIEIDAGSWVGVVGPNGAGKSTFLRAVAGDLHYQGSIVIGGVERVAMDTKTRALALAYVPQRPVYPEGMAVFDYVLLGRTPYMGALAVEKPQDIAAVWDALRALSIAEFAERDVSSLCLAAKPKGSHWLGCSPREPLFWSLTKQPLLSTWQPSTRFSS
jgi:iron complex transport system ATP-binding protein